MALIIVVDNNSSDGSVEFMQQHYPEIRLIQINENLGYAGGYNEALKQIKSEYYILLNSDVEVTSGWLEPVIDVFKKEENTAIIKSILE